MASKMLNKANNTLKLPCRQRKFLTSTLKEYLSTHWFSYISIAYVLPDFLMTSWLWGPNAKKKKKKNLENLGFIPAILDKVVWLFGTYNGTFYILNFITSSLHIFNKYNIFQLMANKYLLIHVYIDTQAHTQICNCIHTHIEIDTYIYVCVCIYI